MPSAIGKEDRLGFVFADVELPARVLAGRWSGGQHACFLYVLQVSISHRTRLSYLPRINQPFNIGWQIRRQMFIIQTLIVLIKKMG